MLSLLLITALAVQTPPASSKPAADSAVQKRPSAGATRGTQSPVSRMAFHDRMRELWSDHIMYTRSFIVSTAAGLPDTAEVLQRLLRNQDEIGEAIKPYYGDPAGSQLTSLLRSHIQLAGKTFVAAKGTETAQAGQYVSNRMGEHRMGDTVTARTDDTTRLDSQNPNPQARMADTTKAARGRATPAYPTPAQRAADTTKNKQPDASVAGDTMAQRRPQNQYGDVRADTNAQNPAYAQGQVQVQAEAGHVDSMQLNQAIAALRANSDSIATFLSKANPRGFALEPLRGALQMHIDLLLKEATAHIKKDWSGSLAAFDESQRQALQMADMLSEGIMKQFPSRFSNRTTSVSTR